MSKKIVPPGEKFIVRCPRLGHQVNFAFCQQESYGLPCGKAIACWVDYFPVQEYFKNRLSREEWAIAFENQPKPKIIHLVELIKKAQKNIDKETKKR